MNVSEVLKSFFMCLVASIAVTVMFWFFLYTLHIDYVMYLAALIGMYVLAGYGINSLINDNVIEDNASRFVLAIVYILIYSVAFMYIMPLVFGAGVFPEPPFNLVNYGIGLDMNFTTEIILAIFGIIILFVNFLDSRN
ncbi:MAG: hypothetical protein IJH65_11270 [Methanobrevibacter sp.]|nr:hypothetical protein [Methanobrevibacter sp.]